MKFINNNHLYFTKVNPIKHKFIKKIEPELDDRLYLDFENLLFGLEMSWYVRTRINEIFFNQKLSKFSQN
jgi:hypothetical protein